MSDIEIKVPNIGDFKDVEVIEVLVKKGQSIKKNDPLITIESDKSSVEIPSSFEGKISKLNIKVGDKVSEGDLILTLEKSSEIDQKFVEFAKVLECDFVEACGRAGWERKVKKLGWLKRFSIIERPLT